LMSRLETCRIEIEACLEGHARRRGRIGWPRSGSC
jgi:hypothetical protein